MKTQEMQLRTNKFDEQIAIEREREKKKLRLIFNGINFHAQCQHFANVYDFFLRLSLSLSLSLSFLTFLISFVLFFSVTKPITCITWKFNICHCVPENRISRYKENFKTEKLISWRIMGKLEKKKKLRSSKKRCLFKQFIFFFKQKMKLTATKEKPLLFCFTIRIVITWFVMNVYWQKGMMGNGERKKREFLCNRRCYSMMLSPHKCCDNKCLLRKKLHWHNSREEKESTITMMGKWRKTESMNEMNYNCFKWKQTQIHRFIFFLSIFHFHSSCQLFTWRSTFSFSVWPCIGSPLFRKCAFGCGFFFSLSLSFFFGLSDREMILIPSCCSSLTLKWRRTGAIWPNNNLFILTKASIFVSSRQ